MPNLAISEYPLASPLELADQVIVERGGSANFRASISQIAGAHSIASHLDTSATGLELDTLTDGSNADALHTHVSTIGGSGTVDTIPLWTPDGNTLGDSIVSQGGGGANISVAGDFFVADSQDGGTVSSQAFNSSNTAGSNAQFIVNVAGSSSGDPFVAWRIDGIRDFVMGIDNSVSGDPFVGSVSATLGTNNWIEVTAARDVTLPTGKFGVGGVPAVSGHFQGAANVRVRVDHTGAGHTALSQNMSGVELLAAGMSTTNKYTGALKFMSTDGNFTTENPKLLGVVVGRATEGYGADTDGGMALDFFTSPDNVGASGAPVLAMTLDQNGNIVVPKASTHGIKVDLATPTFGFADIIGDQFANNTGATKPALVTYNGAVKSWQFAADDEAFMSYHIPHDYKKGTDIFLHIHWSHIGTLVTGGIVTFKITSIYAKGHNQAAFPAPVSSTFVASASTTQYQHVLSEVQYSSSSPVGLQLDTDDLEPDGVIEMTFELDVNGITVSGGGVPDPFIHFVDVHYQTTGIIGTKDKVPDFYI